MFPGFSINAFKLGAACRTINRFRARRSNDWKRRTRLSLKSFSVSRQANDLIIRGVYYGARNMSSGKHRKGGGEEPDVRQIISFPFRFTGYPPGNNMMQRPRGIYADLA
jgi:hypothetical protein